MNRSYEFIYDPEIEIEKPILHVPFEKLSKEDLSSLHHKMEQISGQIPERIRELERKYKEMYQQYTDQEPKNDEQFYANMEQINALSRKIGELNIWYLRMQGRHLTSYQG